MQIVGLRARKQQNKKYTLFLLRKEPTSSCIDIDTRIERFGTLPVWLLIQWMPIGFDISSFVIPTAFAKRRIRTTCS
jgi:hypothetical protein